MEQILEEFSRQLGRDPTEEEVMQERTRQFVRNLRPEDIEGSGLPMKHKKLLHHILKTHTNPKEVGFILGLSKHKDNMGKTPIAKVNIILKALKRLEKRGIKIGDLMNEAEPQQKKSL